MASSGTVRIVSQLARALVGALLAVLLTLAAALAIPTSSSASSSGASSSGASSSGASNQGHRDATQPGSVASPVNTQAIDSYVRLQMSGMEIPGLALVLIRDGAVAYTQGYGNADDTGRPVTASTPFMLGSTSKQLTGLLIQHLITQGKLTLDAPVRTYLPWFGEPGDDHGKITIRQLLSHTSGIANDADQTWTRVDDPSDTLEARARQLAKTPLASKPGLRFGYANGNYDLLAHIAEVVGKAPHATLLQTAVLRPLGMTSTFTSLDAATKAGLAQGHYTWFGLVDRAAPTWFVRSSVPSATTMSTAADLSKLLLAHIAAEPARAGATAAPATSSGLPAKTLAATWVGLSRVNAQVDYASGWFVHRFWPLHGNDAKPNDATVPLVYTHDGNSQSYRSTLWVSPALGYGLVVLTNSDDRISPDRWPAFIDGLVRTTLDRPVPLYQRQGDFIRINASWFLIGTPLVLALLIIGVIRSAGRRQVLLWLTWAVVGIGFLLAFWYVPTQTETSYAGLVTTWRVCPDIGLVTVITLGLTVLLIPVTIRWTMQRQRRLRRLAMPTAEATSASIEADSASATGSRP